MTVRTPARSADRLRGERGQSTVEFALLLPLVALLLLATVQVGLVANDRVAVVHAARAAARAVAVDPTPSAARDAAEHAAPGLRDVSVVLAGDLRPGGLATVAVSARPRSLPVLGSALRLPRMSESLGVRVE